MANKTQNIILSAFISAVVPFSQVTSTPTQAAQTANPMPTVAAPTPFPDDILLWVVKPSETAQSIAASYYGNESYWTTLWNDNEWIVDPKSLPENTTIRLRKSPQITPDELKPSLSVRLQDPKSLSDAEKYAYIMSHTRDYNGLLWGMPILKYKYMSSHFASRHPGIDLSTYQATPIYAAADGTVVEAGWSRIGYGNSVVLAHANGMYTRYAHLSSIRINRGQFVTRGAELGGAGCTGRCTGTHLHFEVYQNGHPINPLQVIQLW